MGLEFGNLAFFSAAAALVLVCLDLILIVWILFGKGAGRNRSYRLLSSSHPSPSRVFEQHDGSTVLSIRSIRWILRRGGGQLPRCQRSGDHERRHPVHVVKLQRDWLLFRGRPDVLGGRRLDAAFFSNLRTCCAFKASCALKAG